MNTDETTWVCEYGFEHDGPHDAELCARAAVFG